MPYFYSYNYNSPFEKERRKKKQERKRKYNEIIRMWKNKEISWNEYIRLEKKYRD